MDNAGQELGPWLKIKLVVVIGRMTMIVCFRKTWDIDDYDKDDQDDNNKNDNNNNNNDTTTQQQWLEW